MSLKDMQKTKDTLKDVQLESLTIRKMTTQITRKYL